ncbi:hypothetical protein KEM48_004465 [Puccinia striiformis f. sp. tritici PST-130]|nr:hypothetical protein KEM48_004465 [Puccinia striiformis f. sp. tritici PST-130]
MRALNIGHILMIEFLCAMSSYPSAATQRLQPRALASCAAEEASTGKGVGSTLRSREGLEQLDDMIGPSTIEKLIPNKHIHSTPDPVATSPERREPRLKTEAAVGEAAKLPKPPVCEQSGHYVSQHILTSLLTKFFCRPKDAPLRPPREGEKKDYDRRKLEAIRASYSRIQSFELGNGKVYNLENLAEMIEEKIPPAARLRTGKGYYDSYLHHLRLLTRAEDSIRSAETLLLKLEQGIKIGTDVPDGFETETDNFITQWLRELDHTKLAKFQEEYEQVLLSLQPAQTALQGTITGPRIVNYFPSLLGKKPSWLWDFVQARAIQLTAKSGLEELAKPVFSTVEEVIHTLPADLDLTSEVYRYSLIKGFEKYLTQEILPRVMPLMMDEAGRQVANLNKNLNGEKLQVDDYINKLGEAEFIRWFGEHPSTVYQKLSQTTGDQHKIVYALKNHMDSLTFTDWETLLDAAANRRVFKKQLQIITERIAASEDDVNMQYLKTLQQLESEAINNNPNNYPYVEELFEREMIDESTRAKLNPPNAMTKTKFMETLGPKEDFKKYLFWQLKKAIWNCISKGQDKRGKPALPTAEFLVIASYAKQIDEEAKKIYLTREAFEQPKAMKFDKVMEVYDTKNILEIFKRTNKKTVIEAYVEAHFPPAVLPGRLETFLNEVHLKQSLLKADGGPLSDLLPTMDKRLAEFVEIPLVKDDERLKGTPWERLSPKSRQDINQAANYLFTYHYDVLNRAAGDYAALTRSVKKFEDDNMEKIPRMRQLFEEIGQRAELPLPHEVSLTTIEQVIGAYNSRLEKNRASRMEGAKLVAPQDAKAKRDGGNVSRNY